ncbi:MAG: hypothetical protein IT370_03790 [Deltaproteobacteria bacterium]|nr:hypothetical protein [Deltaproteobacteria bacterium]
MPVLADMQSAEKHFAQRGDQPWVQPQGFSLICKRPAGTESVDVLWDAPNRMVWTMVGFDFAPAAELRPAMALAICEVNATLAVNGFQLRKGVVWKAHVFLDEQGAVATEVLERAVDLAAATASKFRPYLRAIATGTPPPPLPPRQG